VLQLIILHEEGIYGLYNIVPNNLKEYDLDLKIALIYINIFIHNFVHGDGVFIILFCSLGGSIFTEIQVL
jgi:hypothetical protein